MFVAGSWLEKQGMQKLLPANLEGHLGSLMRGSWGQVQGRCRYFHTRGLVETGFRCNRLPKNTVLVGSSTPSVAQRLG
jgi:hypothetical protein